jgi:hypothetical protein
MGVGTGDVGGVGRGWYSELSAADWEGCGWIDCRWWGEERDRVQRSRLRSRTEPVSPVFTFSLWNTNCLTGMKDRS